MKVLLVLALLLWLGADAYRTLEHVLRHHNTEHNLRGLPWKVGKTYVYDLTLNNTAGIPGASSQVAKSLLQTEVLIKCESETECFIQMKNVKVSAPQSSVPSPDSPMRMIPNPELERQLILTIKFTYVNGKIEKYTLDESDHVYSKCIKRGILRNLEMMIDPTFEEKEHGNGHLEFQPYIYNYTVEDNQAKYDVFYIITDSPNPYFPKDYNVHNISKTMDSNTYGYPSFFNVSNFAEQGCIRLCGSDNKGPDNRYGAGCPEECQPNQSPLKATKVIHHNRQLVDGKMVIAQISAEEHNVAHMYGQDVLISSESRLELTEKTSTIQPPQTRQQEYDELYVVPIEQDVSEIISFKKEIPIADEFSWIYPIFVDVPDVLPQLASDILEKVSSTIWRDDIESYPSLEVTQSVSKFHDILALLRNQDLLNLWKTINERNARDEKQLIKRQLFLESVPIIGTHDSVLCIKSLIREKEILDWEAKEILEAIPENLIEPQKSIQDLLEIISFVENKDLISPVIYMTVSKIYRGSCVLPLTQDPSDTDTDCDWNEIDTYVQQRSEELPRANGLGPKFALIKAISLVGSNSASSILTDYAYGNASDILHLSRSDVNYARTFTMHALRDIAELQPNEIMETVAPIYFNRTEEPRVRIAAFMTLMECDPPMGILQHIAQDSWEEPSREVGSFVYSTFETLGNATTPCKKFTADKIKLVISQMKTFDIGIQHSSSIIKTIFDGLRSHGLEYQLATVLGNTSVIPDAIFTSLEHSIHSMKDGIMTELLMQGITSDDIFKYIDILVQKFLDPSSSPSRDENNVLRELRNIIPRIPRKMRISIYNKIFYTSSFMYIDEHTIPFYIRLLREYLMKRIVTTENGSSRLHIVKTFVPSSIRSISYFGSGLPTEFVSKNPSVYSLKIDIIKEQTTSGLTHAVKVTPVIYYEHYDRKTIFNIADKHEYGVYRRSTHIFTYPVTMAAEFDKESKKISFTYKNDVPQRIYRQHSEAGTYEAELKLQKYLTRDYNIRPIVHIPALYETERTIPPIWDLGGSNIKIVQHSENIHHEIVDLPESYEKLAEQILEHVHNPGCRRRDINATITSAPGVKEIITTISYNQQIVPSQGRPTQDEDESFVLPNFKSQIGRNPPTPQSLPAVENILARKGYVSKKIDVHVDTIPKTSQPCVELKMQYHHALDRSLHHFILKGKSTIGDRRIIPRQIDMQYIMEIINIPSEFGYDFRKFSKPLAPFLMCVSYDADIDRKCNIFAVGEFSKVPPRQLFGSREFNPEPSSEVFYPETQKQCEKDVRKGKSQSAACLAAVLEEGFFNKLHFKVITQDVPPMVLNETYILERALQHEHFENVDISKIEGNRPPNEMDIEASYILKLTDTPVIDIIMEKPNERVEYVRIDPGYLFVPPTSLFSIKENTIFQLTNNTYLPFCGLMEKYISTYDMKEYPLTQSKGKYILSTHCVEKSKFSIYARDINGDRKEIEVHLPGDTIVQLHPDCNDGVYTITYKSNTKQIRKGETVLLDEERMLYVYSQRVYGYSVQYILHLVDETARIRIKYSPTNVKIQVSPLYKGELCGLCSAFDGEITHEYIGPDMCLYLETEDFIRSCSVESEQSPTGPHICPYDGYEQKFSPRSQQDTPSRYPYDRRQEKEDAESEYGGSWRDRYLKSLNMDDERKQFRSYESECANEGEPCLNTDCCPDLNCVSDPELTVPICVNCRTSGERCTSGDCCPGFRCEIIHPDDDSGICY